MCVRRSDQAQELKYAPGSPQPSDRPLHASGRWCCAPVHQEAMGARTLQQGIGDHPLVRGRWNDALLPHQLRNQIRPQGEMEAGEPRAVGRITPEARALPARPVPPSGPPDPARAPDGQSGGVDPVARELREAG